MDDPLFKRVFFEQVILETLTTHLDMRDIVCLASTCKIMHSRWINRKGLHLDRHLKSFFKWKTLNIGAFQTFRKRIFASLTPKGPCIGGCGKLDVIVCVPKTVCPYSVL
jgi:hypothetical protein